jgi:hypothetical protein
MPGCLRSKKLKRALIPKAITLKEQCVDIKNALYQIYGRTHAASLELMELTAFAEYLRDKFEQETANTGDKI